MDKGIEDDQQDKAKNQYSHESKNEKAFYSKGFDIVLYFLIDVVNNIVHRLTRRKDLLLLLPRR